MALSDLWPIASVKLSALPPDGSQNARYSIIGEAGHP
jgi:hypothetical protein